MNDCGNCNSETMNFDDGDCRECMTIEENTGKKYVKWSRTTKNKSERLQVFSLGYSIAEHR